MNAGVLSCSTVPLLECGVVEHPRTATGRESPGASRPPGAGGPGVLEPVPVSRFACPGPERCNKRFGESSGPTCREIR